MIWEFYGELEELGLNILFDATTKISKGDAEISLMGISEYTLFMIVNNSIMREFIGGSIFVD